MNDTSDATLAAARAARDRLLAERLERPFATPARRRQVEAIGRRLVRIAVADIAILIAAVAIGLFVPLGLFGALAVMALLIAATLAFALWPAERAPAPERLRTTDLKALPAQTGRWLEAQRATLPAPARVLVDRIGTRLDTLAPQLDTLDDNSPIAAEIRKLVGEQLPDFIRGYTRVPTPLRTQPRNGKTPDAELTAGLTLIDREIAGMTEQLAQGDLDSLATRGRYLEMRYRDEGEV